MDYHINVSLDINTLASVKFKHLEFLCVTVDDIQKYLDQESVIKIGENYPISDAMRLENSVIKEVVEYLQEVYDASETQILSFELIQEIIAMLTASEIGFARFGNSLGNPLSSWAGRLEDRAWRILMRLYVSQGLNLPRKSIPIFQRLIASKMRSRMGKVDLQ